MEPERTLPQGGATEEEVPAALGTTATVPGATETVESAAASPATEIDWETEIRTRLADIPTERLYEWHPKLKDDFEGRTGRLARQQAEQLANARTQEAVTRMQLEWQRQQREAELDRMAKEDPFALAEQHIQGRQQTVQQSAVQQQIMAAAQGATAHWDNNVLLPALHKLPQADQQELMGRWQRGEYQPTVTPSGMQDWTPARLAFLQDAQERYAEHKSVAKVSERDRHHEKILEERLAALRAELIGAEAEAEGTVDTGGGSAGGGIPSPTQYAEASREQRQEWNARIPDLRHRWAAGKR